VSSETKAIKKTLLLVVEAVQKRDSVFEQLLEYSGMRENVSSGERRGINSHFTSHKAQRSEKSFIPPCSL
jgi:hypothetical protein